MHGASIIHNDLKPQNILLFDNSGRWTAKICDLGNAVVQASWREVPSDTQVAKAGVHEVTLWYRSPEILLGLADYTSAVDLWSLGCIIAEMATGTPLFKGATSQIETCLELFVLGILAGFKVLVVHNCYQWFSRRLARHGYESECRPA